MVFCTSDLNCVTARALVLQLEQLLTKTGLFSLLPKACKSPRLLLLLLPKRGDAQLGYGSACKTRTKQEIGAQFSLSPFALSMGVTNAAKVGLDELVQRRMSLVLQARVSYLVRPNKLKKKKSGG